MIERLLKAKHWQIFLLVFGLPVFIYIGWLISFFSDLSFYMHSDFEFEAAQDFFDGIMLMIVLMLIPMGIMYAWFWSMAIGLQKKLPQGMKMNVSLFKVFFVVPIIFMLLYFLLLSILFGNIEQLEELDSIEHIENLGLFVFGIISYIFLSLFIVFCTFYQYWFIAKTIKSAQLQKDASFGEFVGEFFLVWFYPIGVWILQPAVNKLVEE